MLTRTLAVAAVAVMSAGAAPRTLAPFSSPATEVRLALSADGKLALWGRIGSASDPDGWQILESRRVGEAWSAPKPVSFNSAG